MRKLTKHFELEKWEVSKYNLANLGTEIFIEDQKLCYRPNFKPTSLGVPLSVSRCHPPQVHPGWAEAELNRMAEISSSHVSEGEKHVL
jgi:hypothetical protein